MEQNMNKWIYIKSNRLIDAYVVASVLNDVQGTSYCMVRRAMYAKLFMNHPSISETGFWKAHDEDQLITITATTSINYNNLRSTISEQLGLTAYKEGQIYIPELPDVLDFSLVDIIIMMSDVQQEPLDLTFIDFAIGFFKPLMKTISAGTMAVPCIRGCKDYRAIITWEYMPIIANNNSSALILTNDTGYADLCMFLGLNTIYMKSENGTMYANSQIIKHPDELINMINQQIS